MATETVIVPEKDKRLVVDGKIRHLECSKCKVVKTTQDFNQRRDRASYLSWCKKCEKHYADAYRASGRARENQRKYREANPQLCARRIAESVLKANYGMDFEDWARLYEAQRGRCAGCSRQLLFDWTTHVDHDHKTKKLRGLLCVDCNMILGRVHDNPDTLVQLAMYLEANDNFAPGHPFYNDLYDEDFAQDALCDEEFAEACA